VKKIFFLLNSLDEFSYLPYLRKHLEGVCVSVGEALPALSDGYDLIILWSYRRIIKQASHYNNLIVFHSSDLPEGKGWAPIYYTFKDRLKFHTVTGIKAGDEVDSGDVIVKARFRIRDDHTATTVREWDREIAIILIRQILDRFAERPLCGKKQTGQGSYYQRRSPDDNEIKLDAKVGNIVGHLRGCEKSHPAFFMLNATKYLISIEPESAPLFPKDLEISFCDNITQAKPRC